MACPPSCAMPVSKVTRVRRLGFWKSIARVRPGSGGGTWRPVSRSSALSRVVVEKTRATSAADRSATLSRSRPRSDGLAKGQDPGRHALTVAAPHGRPLSPEGRARLGRTGEAGMFAGVVVEPSRAAPDLVPIYVV